jgi:hypothetical protein
LFPFPTLTPELTYSPNINNAQRGVFVARAKENNFLVRFPRKSPEFNLLFELCVLLSKKDRQGREETGELSCGWAIFHPWKARTDPNMPLNLDVGVHQLTINEGSPFEKGIQMPTTPRTQAGTNGLSFSGGIESQAHHHVLFLHHHSNSHETKFPAETHHEEQGSHLVT